MPDKIKCPGGGGREGMGTPGIDRAITSEQ